MAAQDMQPFQSEHLVRWTADQISSASGHGKEFERLLQSGSEEKWAAVIMKDRS